MKAQPVSADAQRQVGIIGGKMIKAALKKSSGLGPIAAMQCLLQCVAACMASVSPSATAQMLRALADQCECKEKLTRPDVAARYDAAAKAMVNAYLAGHVKRPRWDA